MLHSFARVSAVEMVPISEDAWERGPGLLYNLAVVYALTNKPSLAFEQLAILVKSIGRLFYGQLKLDPAWDSLREDPRFYKLLAELAPSASQMWGSVLVFSTISEIDRLIHVFRIRWSALIWTGASGLFARERRYLRRCDELVEQIASESTVSGDPLATDLRLSPPQPSGPDATHQRGRRR